MAELVPKETLSRLSLLVRGALDDTKGLWETMSDESRLTKFFQIQGM